MSYSFYYTLEATHYPVCKLSWDLIRYKDVWRRIFCVTNMWILRLVTISAIIPVHNLWF
jgi:hypothetical protein